MLAAPRPPTQRDLARGVHRAALARLTPPLSVLDRGRLAGVRGHGAGAWLAALPTAGIAGTRLSVPLMRAAARLWLGVPPVATHARLRCVCGADVDPHGAHFLGDCPERAPGRTRRHSRILYLVRDALVASPEWTDVVLERAVDTDADAGAHGVRFDVRAARVGSGAQTWGDVSVAATPSPKFLARVAAEPSVAASAVRREAKKVAKYGHRLPPADPPWAFTPLVWESHGRVGPATADFLRTALGGGGRRTALDALRLNISVTIWRYNARFVLEGFSSCISVEERNSSAADGGPPKQATFS